MRRLTITTPNGTLEYTIAYRSRVKKRLHMELDHHGELVVVAPEHWSRTHIKATLSQNVSRVEQFVTRARKRHLAPLQYVNGEKHYYLGEKYPLLISHVKASENRIIVGGGELQLFTSALQPDRIQSGLQNWYRQQAKSVFADRLMVIATRAPWAKDRHIPLTLRTMKRTWGNCSRKGEIKLNTHLIKAPLNMIDSVIAHELCHLVEMNHGRAFYALLEVLNPDWQEHRAALRSQAYVYLRT